MAQRTIVTTIDDLDGTEGAETVVFSFKETVCTSQTLQPSVAPLHAVTAQLAQGRVRTRSPGIERVYEDTPGSG